MKCQVENKMDVVSGFRKLGLMDGVLPGSAWVPQAQGAGKQ